MPKTRTVATTGADRVDAGDQPHRRPRTGLEGDDRHASEAERGEHFGRRRRRCACRERRVSGGGRSSPSTPHARLAPMSTTLFSRGPRRAVNAGDLHGRPPRPGWNMNWGRGRRHRGRAGVRREGVTHLRPRRPDVPARSPGASPAGRNRGRRPVSRAITARLRKLDDTAEGNGAAVSRRAVENRGV
jgi:hypothetical protein